MSGTTVVPELNFEYIKSLIGTVEYQYNGCATTCFITIKGTDIVEVGTSHAFDMTKYDIKLGQESAFAKAIDKLFEQEAYHQKRLKGEYTK